MKIGDIVIVRKPTGTNRVKTLSNNILRWVSKMDASNGHRSEIIDEPIPGIFKLIDSNYEFVSEWLELATETPEHDPVNHPKHYTGHPSGVECIDITEHMGFSLGNAMKYIWRADLKNDAIEDLKKAKWYIDRELEKRCHRGSQENKTVPT